jgi:alkylation response protein AidB-like acyl-CoA dehydrogenase
MSTMNATDDLDQERLAQIRMIRESAAGLAPRGDSKRIRALRFKQPGFDRKVWNEMCAMGWVGLRLPEADGGSALGMQEFCAVAEELGAALAPEPLISSALAARVLRDTPLASLLSGDRIIVPALQERANSLAPETSTTFQDGRLNGAKAFVPHAGAADAFIVSTAQGLAFVDRNASGVAVVIQQTQDGGHVGTVTFDDAVATAVAGDISDAYEEATLATSAYLLGVMDAAFTVTLDYLRTRKQFGKAIGSFQALQHRMVDLKLQLALTRASVESAAVVFDTEDSATARATAASRAKARAADASLLLTRQAVQLHGAIGYTDECDIGLYLRKAMTLANVHGSSRLHRARFAKLSPRDDE